VTVPDASRKRRIHDHRDLRVWRKAQKLAQQCRDATATFPPTQANLAGVICRLADEVPNEIATGQAQGQYAPYVYHLERARRALHHLERQLIEAHKADCLESKLGDSLLTRLADIDRMLKKLVVSLEISRAQRAVKQGG
jgi:four helix bundle protein